MTAFFVDIDNHLIEIMAGVKDGYADRKLRVAAFSTVAALILGSMKEPVQTQLILPQRNEVY